MEQDVKLHRVKSQFNQNIEECKVLFRSYFYPITFFEVYSWFCFITIPVVLYTNMDPEILKLAYDKKEFWSIILFPRRIAVTVKFYGVSGSTTSIGTICSFNHSWVYEDSSCLILAFYGITLLVGLLGLLFKLPLFTSYGRRYNF